MSHLGFQQVCSSNGASYFHALFNWWGATKIRDKVTLSKNSNYFSVLFTDRQASNSMKKICFDGSFFGNGIISTDDVDSNRSGRTHILLLIPIVLELTALMVRPNATSPQYFCSLSCSAKASRVEVKMSSGPPYIILMFSTMAYLLLDLHWASASVVLELTKSCSRLSLAYMKMKWTKTQVLINSKIAWASSK